MGLAASQARFLCITARKADCEYKSTDLAQQKLEITNQLSDISNEYSNAMNSTKLIWDNENVANPAAVDYALLMTHSAANDYNPYMLTTASGAIVLNSTYAAANCFEDIYSSTFCSTTLNGTEPLFRIASWKDLSSNFEPNACCASSLSW